MNELGLPPAPPLPDDVRERAHARVRAGLDDAPRWRVPLLAAGAAAVVALVVSMAVALTGSGAPPGPAAPLPPVSGGRPVTSGDAVADQALLRCAAAVNASAERASWPSTSTWRTTAVLLAQVGRGTSTVAIAINDGFACLAGDADVWLTATSGPSVGPVQLVQLTPANVVLLDPQRRPVQIVPEAAVIREGENDAPVQLLGLGSTGMRMSDLRLSVAGVDAGRLPEPAPVGLVAQDRPSISQAPQPPGTSPADCLAKALPGARALVEQPDEPAAVAGTVDGRYVGFCVQGPAGPVFRGADVPAGTGARVVLEPDPELLGVAAVLLAVPAEVTRVTIVPPDSPTPGRWIDCALGGGFALCSAATTNPLALSAYAGSTPVRISSAP